MLCIWIIQHCRCSLDHYAIKLNKNCLIMRLPAHFTVLFLKLLLSFYLLKLWIYIFCFLQICDEKPWPFLTFMHLCVYFDCVNNLRLYFNWHGISCFQLFKQVRSEMSEMYFTLLNSLLSIRFVIYMIPCHILHPV